MYQALMIPAPSNGIQINFCKNPHCGNFGVTPQCKESEDQYKLLSDKGRGQILRCLHCGTIAILKSNKGVFDEYKRLDFSSAILLSALSCSTSDCVNSNKNVQDHQDSYQKFGATASGTPRFRCKACKKTFSPKRKRRLHRRPEINERVFLALVNKLPFNRICEMEDIRSKTLYDKLDYIYEQCRTFAYNKERTLTAIDQPLFMSVDTKNFYLNWEKSSRRKNVCLQTVSTVEIHSGYVLGCHSNLDLSISLEEVEKGINSSKEQCHEKNSVDSFSKYLLNHDYGHERKFGNHEETYAHQGLLADVEAKYNELRNRKDFGVDEVFNENISPPSEGIQIRFDYTLYGHFYWLKQKLPKDSQKIFYLSYDSSLREACISNFKYNISEKTAELFYVRSEKDLSVTQRRKKVKNASDLFRKYQKKNEGMSVREAELSLIKDRMKKMTVIGHWRDHWLIHPRSHMGEPGKVVSHLTSMGNVSVEKLSNYYLNASLFPVKRFYERLQNRVSLLSGDGNNKTGAVWNMYGAYKPSVLIKLIEIFRVYHNYVLTDKFGETPAQRLGLAKKVCSINEILSDKESN